VSGLVLLCADDEAPALDDLTRMLRASERVAEVEGVDGAPAALAALGRRAFDGLFLDVRMPGMDGIEVANRLSAEDHSRVIVLVSSADLRPLSGLAWSSGADALVRKHWLTPHLLRGLWAAHRRR